MEIGTVCTKLSGRERGRECVIVELVDKNFAIIDGPDVRRRRCNLRHLSPTGKKAEIKEGAKGPQVEKALKKAAEAS
jgi:large subunit ribosomal protein L14e